VTLNLRGKCSTFGGPDDLGVAPDEGVALYSDWTQKPELFLSYQPEGTTGLARRLNPAQFYLACRWDYDETPVQMLREEMALVTAPATGKLIKCYPADWGPHSDTDRVCDLSPGAMEALGIATDDIVEVVFPFTQRGSVAIETYERIVISSGHGLYVRGASGILDEVDEARRLVEELADRLRDRYIQVITFHDDASKTQNENLNAIVDFHNGEERDLDVSVHFNAYVETVAPMGTECLYVTQSALAGHVANAIASVGFINRGAKKRTDLFFLNQTMMPSILIEVCFVDSAADADIYEQHFEAICAALARVLGGEREPVAPSV